jgi:hypothetical protein
MNYNNKIYKEVPNFPGYFIDNTGNVISTKPGRNSHKGQIKELKPVSNSKGYMQYYMIAADGRKLSPMQHQLLLRTWVPNPENHPVINHIDGDKQNNTIENLEWCTHKHNIIHAVETGLNVSTCNIPVYLYDLKGTYLQMFNSMRDLSKYLNTDPANVTMHIQGKTSHVKGYLASTTKVGNMPAYTGRPIIKSITVTDLLTTTTEVFTTLQGLSKHTNLHRSKFIRRFKKSYTFIIEQFKIVRIDY